jgi:hypothetical protein
MLGRAVWIACVLLLACSGSKGNGKGTKPENHAQLVQLFFTTELRGTIEPCGCTSDPMGDLARTVKLVETARKGPAPVLFFDGGSTLYSVPKISEKQATQEQLKARVLREALTKRLRASAIGLGPYDFAVEPKAMVPPRHAANIPASAGLPIEAPKVIEAGRAKIGVFGVVGLSALNGIDVKPTDPIAAAKRSIAALKNEGADVIVALAHMTRQDASDLARKAPGIDLMLIGMNAPEPPALRDAPKKVGHTWMFRPANRGQSVVRIEVTIRNGERGPGGLVDAIGANRAKVEIASLDERLAEGRKQLAAFEKDPDADAKFVDQKRQELKALETERKELVATPLRVPESGSYFVFEQVRIKKGMPCDSTVVSEKQAYDRAAGEANVKAAASIKPAKPAKGKPGYEGVIECDDCHSKAVKFWKKTKHAAAWNTLVKLGKQNSYDCINCHVTGWEEPGGSNLAFNKKLRNVQCEVCHGPGSLHIEADGQDRKPRTVRRTPGKDVCVVCHSPEHSDTFDYEAYLRDVTGPGHGEEFRKKLGDGPTGHELRSAALQKAGAAIGAGCPK